MDKTLPPEAFPPAITAELEPVAGAYWRSADGRSFALMATWAYVGRDRNRQLMVQAALDVTQEKALIAAYRDNLVLVLGLGLILSMLIGAGIVRRGLRPLRAMTRAAQGVTASRLAQRIGVVGWPEELRALAGEFDGMLGRLEDSFTKLSQFSADLAHELRTPINNLRGEAEVSLAKARTVEEYREVIASSLEEFERLSRMFDSLLFLARAESSERHIEKSSLDARREIEAVKEFYEAVAAEQSVELICHGGALVCADAILFRRVISNLFSNSLRYTPPNGKIIVFIQPADGRFLQISVKDTGTGIASEHLPHVFDRFYRADPARAQSAKGTGLGLAIVRSIMELHGGEAHIESRVGMGTTVVLRFPSD